MRRKYLLLAILLFAKAYLLPCQSIPFTVQKVWSDTVKRDLQDLETELLVRQEVEQADTTWYGARRQTSFNALRYTLDSRHRYAGDKWRGGGFGHHTFVDFGAGVQSFQHNGGLNLSPQASFHVRVGKELSPMSTLRVGAEMSLGFVEGHPAYAKGWGASVDYLYNFFNYLAGYRPDRPLSVSGLVGVGLQGTHLTDRAGTVAGGLRSSAVSPVGRLGLQMRVMAGAHAALAVEPYVAAGLDRMDLSPEERTQKFDLAYGLKLSYIWYFYNNLSRSADAGDFMRVFSKGERLFGDDPSAANWRRPWFVEYGAGMAYHNRVALPMADTHGYNMSLSLGQWLSSAIGVRASLNVTNAKWAKNDLAFSHTGKVGGYLDALINPFGFTRHYDWDSPVGLNLFAGYGMGGLMATDADLRDRKRGGYASARAGMQLWARLTDGLRLTLEPSYERMEHYGRNDNERIRYDEMDLKLGLQVLFRAPRDRERDIVPAENDLPVRGFYAGGGVGWNTSVLRYHYAGGGRGLVLGGVGMLGYQFGLSHAVQGIVEYTESPYWKPRGGGGMERQSYANTLYSVDYRLNLLNAMTGYRPHRRWNVYLYAGPTYTHSDRGNDFGANAGGMLAFRVLPYLQLYYSHTLYWLPERQYVDGQFYNESGSVVNTLNVGMLYNLDGFFRTVGTASKVVAGGVGAASVGVAHGASWAARTVARGAVGAVRGIGSGVAGAAKAIGALPWKHNEPDGRRPFFVDYGYGYGVFPQLPCAAGDSWGSVVQASAGTWLSSFLGIRAGLNMAKGYGIVTTASDGNEDHDVLNSAGYYALAADVLVNPLGFRKGYDWDAPAGLNLLAGYQVGLASVFDREKSAKNRTFSGLRLGAQLWARLDHNVRLHVEPVWASMRLHSPIYVNGAMDDVLEQHKEGYHELDMGRHFSVKVGLTMLMDAPKTRRETNELYPFEQIGVFAGVGGGWNFGTDKRRYRGNSPRMNGLLFGGMRFDRYSALRLSVELLSDNLLSKAQAQGGAAAYDKRRYTSGIVSLAYQLDLTTLLGGYDENRRWEVDIFGGPAYGHRFTGMDGVQPNTLGAGGGMMVSLTVVPKLSVFYNHNIYLLGASDNGQLLPSEFTMHNFNTLNTFNLGLMYRF